MIKTYTTWTNEAVYEAVRSTCREHLEVLVIAGQTDGTFTREDVEDSVVICRIWDSNEHAQEWQTFLNNLPTPPVSVVIETA